MDGSDAAADGRPGALSLDGITETIWLLRDDLRALAGGDRERFEGWLLLNGAREYRALAEAGGSLSPAMLTQPAAEAVAGVEPVLTRAMRLVWSLRPDLHPHFDLGTAEGQRGFAWWLLVGGARESPVLETVALAACRDLVAQPAAEALPAVQPPLTRFLRLVRTCRPDLQTAFDLRDADGQQAFVDWFFTHGVRELGFARHVTDAQKRALHEPDDRLPGDTVVPVSRLMMMAWRRRSDVRAAFALDQAGGRAAFVAWFVVHGLAELGLAGLVDEAYARFLLAAPAGGLPVSRILLVLWSADAALRQRFAEPGDPGLALWARGEGRERFAILARLAELTERPAPDDPKGARAPATGGRSTALPFGVNLIGYARGQLGIGEDVRMAARAMRAAGLPFSVYNVEPGREVCQGDDSIAALLSDRLPYAVNLFCTTGIETARLAAVEGAALFDGRRTIGFWPWELPDWPAAWRHAYDLVDEVWASSRYTYQAYVGSSPRPVRHMPMAVTVEATAGLGRGDFGLPADRFLFVFAFDALSSLARKNPAACVRAFRTAFPRGDEPVGLVVKAMRAVPGDPSWQALLEDARADRRIAVVARTLDRGAVLDLYRACDCFVSLHRAEGFGRGIAEAMMLGKPVIVTGHSGNMDFTTPGSAALVDHRLLPLAPGDYPFGDGQRWAEPDGAHAAWWMRRLADDEPLRRRLAGQGRALTAAAYAPAVVGAEYAARLRPESG
ncbi:glycosyltransferase [Azospirillum sp. ST 5-10]|uniref:glycosyltransferase n=1 Tax=unclassified Azospirillum TaxID=2630922 RepID=UPI003F4A0B1A